MTNIITREVVNGHSKQRATWSANKTSSISSSNQDIVLGERSSRACLHQSAKHAWSSRGSESVIGRDPEGFECLPGTKTTLLSKVI